MLAATLAAGFAASWQATGQTLLKINIAVAQNSHYGVAIDTFAREVERRTNGRYKVQTFYSAALGAERESVEGVQLGTLDLTLTSTGPLPNFVPEVAILDIPFLFRDYAHARSTLACRSVSSACQTQESQSLSMMTSSPPGFSTRYASPRACGRSATNS